MMEKQGGVYIYRALDKREYLMILWDDFSYFTTKPYVVTPHLNCLIEMVQRMGHNICFCAELSKIIPILCGLHSTALFFGHMFLMTGYTMHFMGTLGKFTFPKSPLQ